MAAGVRRLYGIVDAARDKTLHGLVETCAIRVCLFAGHVRPPLDRVAPYLVYMDPKAALTRTWKQEGWGQSWGILCQSRRGLADLRKQFRRFLQVMLPDGEIAFFRFYDPRVFRIYFPTLTEAERAPWFEAVDEYRVETEQGNGTLYCRPDGMKTVMRSREPAHPTR